jgi:hypothetical protein
VSELDDLAVGDDVTCQWRPGQRGKVVGLSSTFNNAYGTLYRVTWPALSIGSEPETYTYTRDQLRKNVSDV